MRKGSAPETRCNHPSAHLLPSDNVPLTTPIYQSVKFCIESFGELKKVFQGQRPGFFYSRHGNPTVHQLEQLVADIQGYEAGWATSTGISAITQTLLALLKSGDRLLYFVESYRPSRIFAEDILRKLGIHLTRLCMDDEEAIVAALALPDTRVILFESISNPVLKAPPIDRIVQEAKAHGVVTLLDHTFAGFQKIPVDGVDLVIHSLTKFASGHGDVMGGIVLGSREWIDRLESTMVLMGATLDPHAAYLILRGMKTYHLRRRQQVQNALALAEWLEAQPEVEYVLYPGLKSHPQYPYFQERYEDSGSMIFFRLKNKEFPLDLMVDKGECFKLAASLGSTESLITPALYFFGGDLTPVERDRLGLDASAVRLSIGIEALTDLKSDLRQLLDRVGAYSPE